MNKPSVPQKRRYFFDTEFNSRIHHSQLDLISIAIVNENGDEYYGISNEFNLAAARKDQ